jgi:uncharacterized protein
MPRKYAFSWENLGNPAEGRPHLGPDIRLEFYRLMQFCLRDVIEQHHGAQEADRVFYEAGKLAGREFCARFVESSDDFGAFIKSLQRALRDMGLGIFRVEKADTERGEFVFTISEDPDCSGMPDTGSTTCTYDEGFIAALLESFSRKPWKVREVDCWSTGDRTCRFTAVPEGRASS